MQGQHVHSRGSGTNSEGSRRQILCRRYDWTEEVDNWPTVMTKPPPLLPIANYTWNCQWCISSIAHALPTQHTWTTHNQPLQGYTKFHNIFLSIVIPCCIHLHCAIILLDIVWMCLQILCESSVVVVAVPFWISTDDLMSLLYNSSLLPGPTQLSMLYEKGALVSEVTWPILSIIRA